MAYQPKSYRKFLATSVAAAVVATAVAPVAGVSAAEVKFNDISNVQSWAGEAIEYLVERGVIEGYPDGTFKPYASLTRGEAAKILAEALELEIDDNAKTTFADAANHWSSKYIKAIQDQLPGVIDGYTDGTFKPNGSIKRQEMAKMVVEAYELEKDEDAKVGNFNDVPAWAKDYVETLASLGIVNGVAPGKFGSADNVTRAQTAVFVHRTEVPEARLGVDQDQTFTEVTSVEAVTKTVDNSTQNQKLEFTVNGGIKATVEQVENLGYTVEFQSNKDVFNTSTGTLSTDGVLSAGKLLDEYKKQNERNVEFKYQVIISKDDEEFESNSQTVQIVDKQSVAETIGDPKVVRLQSLSDPKGDMELISKTLVVGEYYKFHEVPATLPGNVKVDDLTQLEGYDVDYTTSNESVLVVDSDGRMIPVGTGTATVTISSGAAKKEVTFTVQSANRQLTSAKVAENNVKITDKANAPYYVELQLLDQYGDPVGGKQITSLLSSDDVVSVDSSKKALAEVAFVDKKRDSLGSTDEKGKLFVAFTAKGETGKGTYTIKSASNKILSNITINAGTHPANNVAEDFKLERMSRVAANEVLKVGDTLDLYLNAYNKEGLFMGLPKTENNNLTTEKTNITFRSTNTNVVEVNDNNELTNSTGYLTVTAKGAGTAVIEAYQGNIRLARYTVTVDSAAPQIALVSFHDVKITSTNNAPFVLTEDILNKVVLKDGSKPYFETVNATTVDTVQVYRDEDKDKANKAKLGEIRIVSAVKDSAGDAVPVTVTSNANNANIQIGRGTNGANAFQSGDKGTIFIYVTNRDSNTAIYAKTIQVDVK